MKVAETETNPPESGTKNDLVLEQRAWAGVRLCAKDHITKANVSDRDYYVEIGYHHPRKKFFVEVAYTYRDAKKGTYGGIEFFGDSVDGCVSWIEHEFGVNISIEGEKIAQGRL